MIISPQSQTIPIKIIGGTNFARYPKITDEATINMMVTSAHEIDALVNYAGYRKILDFPSGQPREIYTSTRLNTMVSVIGNDVYLVSPTSGYRLIGRLGSYNGEVYISENGNSQIGIVDNLALYVYNYSANTFQRVDIPDIIPNYITFLDTYFILSDKTLGLFQLSNSGQGTVYNPEMIAQIQTEADQLQAMVALDRTLWALGKKVAELWNDNPTSYQINSPVSFPFQRNNSFSIGYGILSVQSLSVGFGMLVWLAFNAKSGPTIVFTTGGKPQELSGNDDGLDYLLKNLNSPQDSTAFLFQQSGHIIYQITFYTDNLTIAYDFSAKFWYTITDENQNYHIAKRLTNFNGDFYFINFDKNAPALYEMNSDFTTYDGNVIPRIRISPPQRPLTKPTILENFRLDMEQGTSTGRVDMSISKDGGVRYGNVVAQPMNASGNRIGITSWKGSLGICNDFRVKHQFLTTGRVVVTGASVGMRQ